MTHSLRSRTRFAAVLTLPLFAAAGATADTISLTSVADTWMHSEVPTDAAKGTTTYVSTGADSSGADPTVRIARGLLRFDLPSLPEGAVVDSAVLKLTQALANERSGDKAIPISVYRVLQEWSEGDGTQSGGGASWNHRKYSSAAWEVAGADGAADRAATATATVDILNAPQQWDVTADVRQMLAGQAANHGWLVIADDGEAGDRYRFRSRDFETESARPQLEITYTIPEPSAMGVSAAGALLLLRRR